MLDTRYVHLHEALGLGALWLHQHAKVLPAVPAAAPIQKQPAPVVAAPSVVPSVPSSTQSNPTPTALPAIEQLRQLNQKNQQEKTEKNSQAIPETDNISWAEPPRPARVLILSVCASLEDRMRQKLFSGEDGVLLHKMLAAIQLSPQDVHCSTWLKHSAHFNPRPSENEVQAAWASVYDEWQQCGKPVLWLLGDFFEREDVQRCLQACASAPIFMTSHPLRLLKYPELKRDAWNTLQQMQATLMAQPT